MLKEFSERSGVNSFTKNGLKKFVDSRRELRNFFSPINDLHSYLHFSNRILFCRTAIVVSIDTDITTARCWPGRFRQKAARAIHLAMRMSATQKCTFKFYNSSFYRNEMYNFYRFISMLFCLAICMTSSSLKLFRYVCVILTFSCPKSLEMV